VPRMLHTPPTSAPSRFIEGQEAHFISTEIYRIILILSIRFYVFQQRFFR